MSGPYLEISNGRSARQVAIEGGRLTIGRHADCGLVIDDTLASRTHCLIERVGAEYILRDLNSRNGTKVNGQLVTTAVLAPGDVIVIGTNQMTFSQPEEIGEE